MLEALGREDPPKPGPEEDGEENADGDSDSAGEEDFLTGDQAAKLMEGIIQSYQENSDTKVQIKKESSPKKKKKEAEKSPKK
jgi:hypothetical protein